MKEKKIVKMFSKCKRNTGAQPEILQGRGGFMELDHFDKHFVKNKRKRGCAWKNFGFFSPKFF